jgi:hypothetical protein
VLAPRPTGSEVSVVGRQDRCVGNPPDRCWPRRPEFLFTIVPWLSPQSAEGLSRWVDPAACHRGRPLCLGRRRPWRRRPWHLPGISPLPSIGTRTASCSITRPIARWRPRNGLHCAEELESWSRRQPPESGGGRESRSPLMHQHTCANGVVIARQRHRRVGCMKRRQTLRLHDGSSSATHPDAGGRRPCLTRTRKILDRR